jgi:hypothetical protein
VSSLRTSAYPDTALPAAFSSAKATTPSTAAHKGAVEFDVDGPDVAAGVIYVVFGGSVPATGLGTAVPVLDGLQVKAAGTVPGHAAGSALYTGSYSKTDALGLSTTEKVVYAIVAHGNVLVAGFTYAPEKQPADRGGAIALVRSGLAHLKAVTGA